MLSSILAAIVNKFGASELAGSLGGLYYGTAPQGTTGDYVTYFVVDGGQDLTFTERFEDLDIQFSIWTESDDVGDVMDYADDLHSLFDFCGLDITGGNLVEMRRLSNQPIPDLDGGWQHVTRYRLQVQRQ